MQLNVVFFGSDSFARLVLAHLIKKNFKLSAIVTKEGETRVSSRRKTTTPVKMFVDENTLNIPHFCPHKASTPEFISVLSEFKPDLFIVCGYGEIIKKDLLELPKLVCINIHPSQLPKYRGATPIQSTLMNGESETAVSLMQMVLQMDAGAIYKQIPIEIEENDNYEIIENKLSLLCIDPLIALVNQFSIGETVDKVEQDESQVTFCKKIFVQDCKIDWNKSALEVHNLIRACSTRPIAWTNLNINGMKKKCKILESRVHRIMQNNAPGTILEYSSRGSWIVQCYENALEILLVQLEGKKVMDAKNFMNGVHSVTIED